VNKVATAVELRFNVRGSTSLPEDVRLRLLKLAHNRISAEGVLTIDARRYRTQEQNRQDARERLAELVRKATEKPKARRATKPTRAAKERRLESKRRTGQLKKSRQDANTY
jgi:ribosome-associated protein